MDWFWQRSGRGLGIRMWIAVILGHGSQAETQATCPANLVLSKLPAGTISFRGHECYCRYNLFRHPAFYQVVWRHIEPVIMFNTVVANSGDLKATSDYSSPQQLALRSNGLSNRRIPMLGLGLPPTSTTHSSTNFSKSKIVLWMLASDVPCLESRRSRWFYYSK